MLPSVHYKLQIKYNPNSLQEAFCTLPTLFYDSDKVGKTIEDASLIEVTLNIFLPEFNISEENKWLDRDTIKNLLKDNLTFSESYLEKMPGVKTYISFLSFTVPFASFKNGHLKEISATTERYYVYTQSLTKACFSNVNYKGNNVEDKFEMAGYAANQVNNITTDESYVVVMYPILFLCPLINGIFTLGTLAGTSDMVLINCIEMDTKFIREKLGLPESVVIPCKEGEYIKYPNIYVPDEAVGMTDAVSIEDTLNENRQMILDRLKKQVASLEEDINTSTQEEKKAVVD